MPLDFNTCAGCPSPMACRDRNYCNKTALQTATLPDGKAVFLLLTYRSGVRLQIPTTYGEAKKFQIVVHRGKVFKYSRFQGIDVMFEQLPESEVFFNPEED